jgi:hypothetical protein
MTAAKTRKPAPTKGKRRKRRSPRWPGFTIAQFAALPEVDVSEAMIRHAVEDKTIDHVLFNGVKIIPTRERAKWREIWGDAPATPGAPDVQP